MDGWRQVDLAAAAQQHATKNTERWASHIDLMDSTVHAMFEAAWIHPWMDFRAKTVRTVREFMAGQLIVPAHVAQDTSIGFPDGVPGSDEEAQSYGLHLLTGAVLRSLSRSGYLALCGLALESVGTHRRTVESLLQIELLVDHIELSRPCCKLAFTHDRPGRKQNDFLRAADRRSQQINNLQVPESDLTALQGELRRSAKDAALHLGPHAGLIHGWVGKHRDRPFEEFDPMDVGHDEVGPFLWRYAAQTWKLCSALLPKLDWVRKPTWEEAGASLEAKSAEIESGDRQRRRQPSNGKTPWSSLSDD